MPSLDIWLTPLSLPPHAAMVATDTTANTAILRFERIDESLQNWDDEPRLASVEYGREVLPLGTELVPYDNTSSAMAGRRLNIAIP